ncbi:hypothetical protein [Nonomuraea guangzhouensis]|uniref:Agglutinin receptor n=1 Tax=Nonomuraea guangzhouensis TaxID=1291555 RepID=A0ABW4GHE9_9ACTN|nr:hypothetical protein [Nonomuraea guangzhouensis]
MSKLDVTRLREPAAWLMLAGGGLNILVAIGKVLVSSSASLSGELALSFADRAFSNFGNFTSPVTTALLLGSVLLLTKVGPPSPQAKPVAFGAAAMLGIATLFGAITLVLGLFAGNGARLTAEFGLRGVPVLALTGIALVYLLPLVLPDRPAVQPQQGYGQQFPNAPYGQQPPLQQPYGEQPPFAGGPAEQQSYGQQPPSYGGAPEQPGYVPQPPSYGGPVEQPAYGQQPPSVGGQPDGQGAPVGQPGYVPQPPSYGGPVEQPGYVPQPPSYGGQSEQPGYGQPASTPQPATAAFPATADQNQGQPDQGFPQPQPGFGQTDPSFSQPKPEYQPAPYVPADSEPNAFAQPYNTPDNQAVPYVPADSQPNAYAPADSQPNAYAPADSPANGYQTADSQPNAYAPAATPPNTYAPADGYQTVDSQPNAYAPAANPPNPFAPIDNQPNPWAPTDQPPPASQQQPLFGQQPYVPNAFDQPQGQPFTGFSGQEYATPAAYQEPDPPVDPRSQQLLDAYQQAETYQHSANSGAPDLRVPDYASQQQASPYDDPFGHPQQLQQPGYPPQPPAHQAQPPAHQAQYEPQPAQYEPQPYQPHHQAARWNEPPTEATVRLDQSMFQGDALGGAPGQGDDPIDPTAIYAPNEPRR